MHCILSKQMEKTQAKENIFINLTTYVQHLENTMEIQTTQHITETLQIQKMTTKVFPEDNSAEHLK